MTSLPTLLLLLLLLLAPFQLSLSFPVIPSAAMCNLVYPKHGEMLPVNVDDEGNEENAVMWVLIDCSFSSEGWNEIMSNNGSMLIGIQEVQPFDFAINDGKVTYVLDKVRNNVPKFFVSELALSFAWTEPPSASKNFVFTINIII